MSVIPVIVSVTTPVAVGNQVVVTGINFGRVSTAAIVNISTSEIINTEFMVDSGVSVHLTVPRNTPEGLYTVLLGTLDETHSTYTAASLLVTLSPSPFPPAPVFPTPGTSQASVRDRLRYEIGDYTETFAAGIPGDGYTLRFELPAEVVNAGDLSVVTVTNDPVTSTALIAGTDYVLTAKQGIITLVDPVPASSTLNVSGTRNQFFLDAELNMFIASAALKHTHSGTVRTIVHDPTTGRTQYTTTAEDLTNLPAVEEHPLALLAAIEALWVIAADASYDIDVTTAEGTNIPRQERYRAIMEMITAQQQRYDLLCRQLNVGLGRLEMFTLRRVSYTTGRLVPIYQPREIGENEPPMQVYPPVDRGVTGTGSDQRVPFGEQYFPGTQP